MVPLIYMTILKYPTSYISVWDLLLLQMGNSTEQNNLLKVIEKESDKIYSTARNNWNCYYDLFPMLSMFLVAYIFASRSHSSIRDKLNFPFIIFIWENVFIEETHLDKESYHCKNRFQLCKLTHLPYFLDIFIFSDWSFW